MPVGFSEDKRANLSVFATHLLEEAKDCRERGEPETDQEIRAALRGISNEIDSIVEVAGAAGIDTLQMKFPLADEKIRQLFVKYCTKT